jgi:hypothetical protein
MAPSARKEMPARAPLAPRAQVTQGALGDFHRGAGRQAISMRGEEGSGASRSRRRTPDALPAQLAREREPLLDDDVRALDDRQLWNVGVARGDIRLVAANQNDWRPAA